MKSKVYFVKEISKENLVKTYDTLNVKMPGKEHFIERVEFRNGVHTIEAIAEIGVGSRVYELEIIQ